MEAVVEKIIINSRLVEALSAHAKTESKKGGYEAVGFVARRTDSERITTFVRLNNHASDPTKAFFVEPWEQFRAEAKLSEAGYEIVGVFHSHPASQALPSRMDVAKARPGELLFIYGVPFEDFHVYRERDGELYPVEVEIFD